MFQLISDLVMGKLVQRASATGRVEHFRARVPYAFVSALTAYAFALPVAGLLLLAQLLGYRGTDEMSLTRSWLLVALAPLGIAGLIAAIAALGWLSGYRHFRRQWENLDPRDAQSLSELLRGTAERHRFQTVWRDPADAGFVAVRDIYLDQSFEVLGGSKIPMRLSFLLRPNAVGGRMTAEFKVANRALCVWDTGERRAVEATGEAILREAGVEG